MIHTTQRINTGLKKHFLFFPVLRLPLPMLGTAKNHGDENAWFMDVIQPPLRLARAESVSSAWYSAECVRGYNSE
jgi:hypothetical protein